MLNKKKNNKGFTLVELLVVIAIIGILAVVAVPSLFKNINKAKAADVVSYVSAIKTSAISLYAEDEVKATKDITNEINDLIDDAPKDVELKSVEINPDGSCVINVTVQNNDIKKKVYEQFADNQKTKVIVNVAGSDEDDE